MKKILLLGMSHGINDCLAGYVLGRLMFESLGLTDIGISILIYNLIAFGGQVPFSGILKEHYYPKRWLISCFCLMIAGLFVFDINYKIAVFCLGLSSAIIHVVGGYETIKETDKAIGLGIFASPGVIGLVLGGYLAHIQLDILFPTLILCAVFGLIISFIPFSRKIGTSQIDQSNLHFDSHDIWMILILTVIAFRSAIWNVFQLVNEGQYETLFIIGFSAMAGKIVGGYFSDIIGHRKYTLIALAIALPLLTFLKNNLWSLAAGIFLLQSTVPSTARIMIGYFRHAPIRGVSFIFGLPIILSGILFYTPLQRILSSTSGLLLIFSLGIGILVWESRKRRLMKIE